MRQVMVAAFGGPENLIVQTRPEPQAGFGQVRVRVRTAGLNPVDAKIASGGSTAERFGVTPPFGNGNDFAGIIDQAPEVSGWSPGARVYGGARFSAQSEFLVVSDLSTLNATPSGLPDELAGALDIAGRTALAGVESLALTSADTVLISGAAGGVGVLAVQLARRTGARVLAVASERNHAALLTLDVEPFAYGTGLEQAIRSAAPDGVTALLDCHGGGYVDLGINLGLNPTRINSVADRASAARVGAQSKGRADTPTHAVRLLAQLLATGEVVLPIAATFPLDRVVDAYRFLESGPRFGKVVLTLP